MCWKLKENGPLPQQRKENEIASLVACANKTSCANIIIFHRYRRICKIFYFVKKKKKSIYFFFFFFFNLLKKKKKYTFRIFLIGRFLLWILQALKILCIGSFCFGLLGVDMFDVSILNPRDIIHTRRSVNVGTRYLIIGISKIKIRRKSSGYLIALRHISATFPPCPIQMRDYSKNDAMNFLERKSTNKVHSKWIYEIFLIFW